MAPPQAHCSFPDCDFVTPRGVADHTNILTYLTLHIQTAHAAAANPVPAPAAQHNVTAKIDKITRPLAKRDMTEHKYKFFKNE